MSSDRTNCLRLFAALLIASPVGRALAQTAPGSPAPPLAERRAHVETLFGEVRSDDYFWLRNKQDPAVRAYLEAENAYAERVMAPMAALRDTLYSEMLRRIRQTDLSVPYPDRGYVYYSRTVEGQQYPIYCRRRGSMDAPEEVLLDLNEMARGKSFMGLGAYTVSDDGHLLAFSVDTNGFRQYALYVKDLRTGRLLPDTRWPVVSVAWAADHRTLFYTVEDHAKRPYRLYRHELGAERDSLLYEERDERFRVGVSRTRSAAWLILSATSATTSEMRVLRAADPRGGWLLVSPRRQDREYYLDHQGDRFYILVNDTGRNFRLVSSPAEDPREENWREVIPHDPEVMLEDVDCFAGHYVVSARVGGLPRLRVTSLATGRSHDIRFPEPVYSAFASVNREFNTRTFRYTYQSFVTPLSVFDYDMDGRRSTLLKETEVLGGYDRRRYASERIHATAPDGVRVPISLVYRRGLRRDGRAPMLLYGYGSYGASSNVTFSSNRLSLLDRGVVYAIAHIRGGGELGKAWHDDGRMMRKMNTFTDFIAAAEHLVAQRYTARDRLAAQGGSAGGLLMGAVTNLRPDLFRVVVANVPFVDVINTMLDSTLPLTVGEFEEWGNPRIESDYRYMRQYSPYDNLAPRDYPSILVTTSFNDSQVLYHEPAKYVARMRSLSTGPQLLVFVTNMGAGHGGASGRYDRLREIARDWAFVLWELGVRSSVAPATP
jgi:oligopeptidase B